MTFKNKILYYFDEDLTLRSLYICLKAFELKGDSENLSDIIERIKFLLNARIKFLILEESKRQEKEIEEEKVRTLNKEITDLKSKMADKRLQYRIEAQKIAPGAGAFDLPCFAFQLCSNGKFLRFMNFPPDLDRSFV